MSKRSKAARNGLMLGMLLGGAAGAAVALLTAPKSGKELRGDLADATNQYKEKLGTAAQKAGQSAKTFVGDGLQRGKELLADARSKAGLLVTEAEEILGLNKAPKSFADDIAIDHKSKKQA